MRTNVTPVHAATTHEGGKADPHIRPLHALRRAVSTCLLWENTFYEKGNDIAARIADLATQVTADELAAVAVEARARMHLRHVPLWLVRQLARLHTGGVVGDTLAAVIQRPDEIAEFLSLYWKDGGRGATPKLSAQVKRGLRAAFGRFGEHALAKWNRDGAVKLRDALFLCHAKPRDDEQTAVWKKLIAGELTPPDTWEVALSSGANKRETWERLLREHHLGYQALLMNLRNMVAVGVDEGLVRGALADSNTGRGRMFPYRFIAAARAAPGLTDAVSDALIAALQEQDRLVGQTVVLVDVSGSMAVPLSGKAETTRIDAAASLAVVVREVCDRARVFTFSYHLVEVPNHRGLALVSAIDGSQQHGATYLRASLEGLRAQVPNAHRVIVVTDEQSADGILRCWCPRGYLVNVAPYKPGLDTHEGWTRVNGWSDRVLDWIRIAEQEPEA